jgi:hypothetical protein
VLDPKKKFNINMNIVRSLVRLMRLFKVVIPVIQKDAEPSFCNLLVSVLTLRAASESASSRIGYETSFDDVKDSNDDQLDDNNDDHL